MTLCLIPALIVVQNNGALDLSKLTQTKNFRDWPTWVSLTGDYAAVAKALGAHAEKVERPDPLPRVPDDVVAEVVQVRERGVVAHGFTDPIRF